MKTIKEINKRILEAVARGWCHKETEHLTMDDRLANAITKEVTIEILSLIEELEGKKKKL